MSQPLGRPFFVFIASPPMSPHQIRTPLQIETGTSEPRHCGIFTFLHFLPLGWEMGAGLGQGAGSSQGRMLPSGISPVLPSCYKHMEGLTQSLGQNPQASITSQKPVSRDLSLQRAALGEAFHSESEGLKLHRSGCLF